ncbi:MAG: hypothetical protein KDA93_00320 [Planctomycetaceae bacterium]|nr:hypothetical protein [Planctomycetaceae bacterium]
MSDPIRPKRDPYESPWAELKYPDEEQIAALPDYVHPATRLTLGVLCIAAGSIAMATGLMRILGGEVEAVPGAPPIDPTSLPAAWVGLVCGLCWLMAGITISAGRVTATGIWFLLGLISGVLVTIL